MIDGLIGLVERNTTMWRYWVGAEPLDAPCDWRMPVVFALLARSIWDAIVNPTAAPGSVASLLETAFGGDAIARELYDDHLGEVASALRPRCRERLHRHARPVVDTAEDRPIQRRLRPAFGEMIEYLHRAGVDWHDDPAIQTGLDRHTEPTMKLLDLWASDERGTCEKGRANVLIDLGRACATEGRGGRPLR